MKRSASFLKTFCLLPLVLFLVQFIFTFTGCNIKEYSFDFDKLRFNFGSINCDSKREMPLQSKYLYRGSLKPDAFKWLIGRKVFIDPGHGGKGLKDRFRIGPEGITEEEVNLRVALILSDMLLKSGAVVKMSRSADEDIPVSERVKMAEDFNPEILVSIHHNGSPRRADGVNYPVVLIWGNKHNRPLSYDFASLLLKEFHGIMKEPGQVLSDFSVFLETGTEILRETRYLCPGVIGEGGFFSDEMHAQRLRDHRYNELEAEAYFNALSEFFKKGLPDIKVYISCPVDNSGILTNRIDCENPVIATELLGGAGGVGVIKSSLRATLDGMPLRYRFVNDSLCLLDYGKRIYPGGHNLRMSFVNVFGQHSMIYRAGLTVDIKRGDYARLIHEGKRLLDSRRGKREGLEMLISALSMSLTGPDADMLIWNIARGFSAIGDRDNSSYYYSRLYHFYPESRYAGKVEKKYWGYRYPVEYYGKSVDLYFDPSLVKRYPCNP